MVLTFKQRFFSWFGSYDVNNEYGETIFTVKGKFSFGRHYIIYDAIGNEIGQIKQELFNFRPTFSFYKHNTYIGCITKEFTFFKPRFNIDLNGWQINGDFFEWNYTIDDPNGNTIATASKMVDFTDSYFLDIRDPENALSVLMIVLVIDAEKEQRD